MVSKRPIRRGIFRAASPVLRASGIEGLTHRAVADHSNYGTTLDMFVGAAADVLDRARTATE
jgi:DNA-binding transcriptional regulator YbjK